jgi:formate hydrogenlyase subunit 6/NADH:ubiquinone oxidoreductase subunit I
MVLEVNYMIKKTILGDIIGALFGKSITINYPKEKSDSPNTVRGKIVWEPDNCNGCKLCILDCPTCALELLILDKNNKKFVMRYNLGQCIFCGQCEISCIKGCLKTSKGLWELASVDKKSFEIYYGQLEDIEKYTCQ